jgi:hypothetical protein
MAVSIELEAEILHGERCFVPVKKYSSEIRICSFDKKYHQLAKQFSYSHFPEQVVHKQKMNYFHNLNFLLDR